MKRTVALLGIISIVLCVQAPVAAQRGIMGQTANLRASGFIGQMPAVPGKPYYAEAVNEHVQILPDGNRIVQTTTSAMARDGEGRTYRENSMGIAVPGRQREAPKLITIDDPVAGVHWFMDSHTKTAVKTADPKRSPTAPNTPMAANGAAQSWFYSSGVPGTQIITETMGPHSSEEMKANQTDLGTQTIEGVLAQGSRVSHTLPVGAVGNEQPLTIVSERWYSPDLHMLVMSKSEDPRVGITTYRLTNIRKGEPLPSLFEVPSGYTVKE